MERKWSSSGSSRTRRLLIGSGVETLLDLTPMSEIKLGESQGGDFLGEAPHLILIEEK